jgi:chemotaxis family two-component system response regulator Rcp1
LDSLSGRTPVMSLPEAVLAWRFAGESLSDTEDESTSSPNPGADPFSSSRCLSEAAARYRILVVEDNRADVFLIREAIAQTRIGIDLHLATDGEKAVEFIFAADSNDGNPAPDLILLDLNLPRKSGAEVLRHIRRSRRCAGTPVLIVSSSDSERDRADAARFGASGYFRKPSSYAGFMKLGAAVRELLCPESPGSNPGDRQ